ncbi:MAG: MlaD family protein [bacterium]
MRRSRDVVVGAVTLIALALLVIFTVKIKETWLFAQRYNHIVVYFKKVKGLEQGAPVNVAGVTAGDVADIKYDINAGPERPVRVTVRLQKGIRIYGDAVVKLATTGLIGETRVDVDPGTPKGEPLKDGDTLNGLEQVELEGIINDLAVSMATVREILTLPETKDALVNTLRRLDSITAQLESMLGKGGSDFQDAMAGYKKSSELLNSALLNLDKSVAEVTDRIVAAADQITTSVVNVEQGMTAGLDDIREATAQLREIADNIRRISESVNQFTTENREKVGSLLSDLQATGQEIRKMAEGVEQGRGTLGLLLTDPKPFQDLQEATSMLRAWLTGENTAQFPTTIPFEGPAQPRPKVEQP